MLLVFFFIAVSLKTGNSIDVQYKDRRIQQSTNSALDLKYQLVVSYTERVIGKLCQLN